MSKFNEDIKTLLDVLCKSFTNETMENNENIVNKVREMSKDKNFLDKLEHAQHDFTTIIAEIINVPEQKNIYIVQYIVSGLYENFFKRLMEKVEGSSCCADKSRFIRNMTLKALKENTNLSLYEDYTNYDQISDDKESQAYWSPKTIIDTDTAMKVFWDWYLLRV